MGGLVIRLRGWWDTADRSQRTITVVGGGFLVVLLIATFIFASKPKMTSVFPGLDPAEVGSVAAELDKLGIQYDTAPNGELLVPSDQKATIRIKLAAAGKLPTSTKFGDEDFSKIGMLNTPAVERERLKSILESHLSESVQAMDGVQSARVQLSLGEESPFVHDQKEATASVTVTERSGSSLGSDQGRTIAILVSKSVPGLAMKNVAVVNNRMEMLFDGSSAASSSGRLEAKLQTEELESKRRQRELQAQLDQTFGAATTVATVAVELDFDHKKTEQVTATPSEQPVTTRKIAEKASGGDKTAGGIASNTTRGIGTPSTGQAPSGDGKYNNAQVESTFLPNTTTTTTEPSAGNLVSMSVNVIANTAKIKNPQLVESVLAGYLGAHANQPGFSYKVTPVEFDTSGAKAATDAAGSAASQQRMQQIISLLPVGALLAVAFMVIKSFGKFAKNPTIMVATPDGQMLPMPAAGLPVRAGQLRGNEILVAAGQAAAPSGAPSHAPAAEAPDVGSIESKINVPLEQIKKMSEERPEVVAVLIKSWLLEDR